MDDYAKVVRAQELPPQIKHKIIFEAFDALGGGEAMLLVNDHDPVPLFYQFQATRGDTFTWEYVEQGPELFRVKIGKVG
ncbi:DUF2249 domain-containing protein [Paenibacillus antri]|uniref:DUF2249 domain-containing protein n=1 Tax=Paenibacillus antri TaxID=2582848 RepID=A0A5R9GGX6_9BACL|nr:DUF2249 domain-containing protein [Paenibacillus antri]TLS50665.1 DUF2249 domain-containing protein [Paenibacillus antri]